MRLTLDGAEKLMDQVDDTLLLIRDNEEEEILFFIGFLSAKLSEEYDLSLGNILENISRAYVHREVHLEGKNNAD